MLKNCSNLIDCEKELLSRTRKDHLIGETALTPKDIDLLGYHIKKYLDNNDVDYLKYTTPACVSHFLVWKGIFEYVSNEGNFWSAIECSLGNMDPNTKTKLGNIFVRFLKNNDLPFFELPGAKKYVTNILLHGTIPDSNLEEYFEKIICQKIKELPSTDLEGIEFFLDDQRESEIHNLYSEDDISEQVKDIEYLKDDLHYKKNIIKLWTIFEDIEKLKNAIDSLESTSTPAHVIEQKNELALKIINIDDEIHFFNSEIGSVQKELNLISPDQEILSYFETIRQIELVLKYNNTTEYRLQELVQTHPSLFGRMSNFFYSFFNPVMKHLIQRDVNAKSCENIDTPDEKETEIINELKRIAVLFNVDVNQDSDLIINDLKTQINYTDFQRTEDDYLHKYINSLSDLKENYQIKLRIFKEELEKLDHLLLEENLNIKNDIEGLYAQKLKLESSKDQLLSSIQNNDPEWDLLILREQGTSKDNYIELTQEIENEIETMCNLLQVQRSEPVSNLKSFPYVNEPIRRFLLYGDALADNFLYQSFRMLEFAQENRILDYRENIDLPDRIVDRFIEWWNAYDGLSDNDGVCSVTKNGRFTQPIIKFDDKDDIIVLVPIQKIAITDYNEKIILSVNPSQLGSQKISIDAYKNNTYIETDETKFKLLSPSKKYVFQLLKGDKILHTWSYEDIFKMDCSIFVFDYESKKLHDKEQLPKDRLLIITENKFTIGPESVVFEEGELFGKWGNFRYWAVDIREGIDSLWLEDNEGNHKEFLLHEKRNLQPNLIDGELLNGCSSDCCPVYLDVPPSISLNFVDNNDINNWNIYIYHKAKSTLEKSLYSKLSQIHDVLHFEQSGLKCVIPLSNKQLLGNAPVGNFTIRLVNSIENIDKQFDFTVIPSLKFEFSDNLYIPKKESENLAIQAEINSAIDTLFVPELPAKIINNCKNSYLLETDWSQNSVKGTLRYLTTSNNPIDVQLDFPIPKLTWCIEGLKDNKFQSEFSEIIEIQEDTLDDRQDNEVLLIVSLPSDISGKCILNLSGCDHSDEVLIKRGIAKFNILRFIDTIRSSKKSEICFETNINSNSIQLEGIPLFSVQKWKVKDIDHEISTDDDGYRIFDVSWKEEGYADNRTLALWKLTATGGKLVTDIPIKDGFDLQLKVIENKVDIGRYLLHFTKKDDWKPLSFPGENAPNSKEILIDIDDDAPLIAANEMFEKGQYLEGVLHLKECYEYNDHLKSTWLHKINHSLIYTHKFKEAIEVFNHLLYAENNLADTDSFHILIRLLNSSDTYGKSLEQRDIICLLDIIVHILLENCHNKRKFRESSMVIMNKKTPPLLFSRLKEIYPEQGSELETILNEPKNDILCSKLENAKEIIYTIEGTHNVA
ncbi:MAG: hypothetical protein PWQ50_21 [Methanolobus sp.]|jgi:hypothetical protein|nr:hypothetical protein [Methanolobus sp.]